MLRGGRGEECVGRGDVGGGGSRGELLVREEGVPAAGGEGGARQLVSPAWPLVGFARLAVATSLGARPV